MPFSANCATKSANTILYIMVTAMIAACVTTFLSTSGLVNSPARDYCPVADHYAACDAMSDARKVFSYIMGASIACAAVVQMGSVESGDNMALHMCCI